MIGEYNSPTPDLILFDSAPETTKVIIEVCQTVGLKADLKKVIELIDGEFYGIERASFTTTKPSSGYAYQLGDVGVATGSSFSTVPGLDLNLFLA